jgi:hypothetical protein
MPELACSAYPLRIQPSVSFIRHVSHVVFLCVIGYLNTEPRIHNNPLLCIQHEAGKKVDRIRAQ